MKRFLRTPHVAAAFLIAAVGCTDAAPPTAIPDPDTPKGGQGGTPQNLVAVTCNVDVASERVSCGEPEIPENLSANVIVGGQGQFVRLIPGSSSWDAGTFTTNMSVQNLIPQALGTTDGVTLDPTGVQVFLQGPPTVTSGSGTITPVGDGVSIFTASDQTYWQYNSVLETGETSAPISAI